MWDVADTFDFPQDLLDAQRELHQVQAEMHALYERLPWSAVPMAGYGEDFWLPRLRTDSPGYTDEEKAQGDVVQTRSAAPPVSVTGSLRIENPSHERRPPHGHRGKAAR